MSAPSLVVGYGNTLRADDGVGPMVADWLAADPRMAGVTVMARHQLTPDLAEDVARAAFVVLIDASSDEPPGEISVRAVDATGSLGGATSHHVDPSLLVALAAELYGRAPQVVVVGVGVATVAAGDGLSEPVQAALPRIVDTVVQLIAERIDEPDHA